MRRASGRGQCWFASNITVLSSPTNLRNIAARRPAGDPCFLASAETGEGIEALLAAIEQRLAAYSTTLNLSIDAADGAGISWLHRNAEVLNKELHDGRFDMIVRVDETKRDIVVKRFDAVPRGYEVRCRSRELDLD